MRRTSLFLVVALVALTPLQTKADSVTVGDLEFNNLSTGINDFTVNNFTGSNNLGFFPVNDNVTFQNIVLTATESNSTVLTFDISSLGPGTDTSAQVADSLFFTKVVFTATVSPTTFSLTNGSSGTFIANPTVSFTLLPSAGPYLVAGTDLGTFDASSSSAAVPEPSTLLLLAFGLLAIGAQAKKRATV